MRSGGCWSSVVATAEERAVLRLTTENDWLVACVLPEGHEGAHGSDGAQQHVGRRRWLMWGDYARGAQNLSDELECPAQALDGAPCLFFGGHGGPHRYAAPVGQDFPAGAARHGSGAAVPVTAQASPPVPAPMPPPVPAPRFEPSPMRMPPALPPEDTTTTLTALDDLFSGMPSLKGMPPTEMLTFPSGSFSSPAPAWPDSRGEYVAEHHLERPTERETVVSGPNRFEPSRHEATGPVIDAGQSPEPVRGRRRRDRRDQSEANWSELSTTAPGRHGSPTAIGDAPTADAHPVSPSSRWLEVRPGTESVLTTPLIRVISSNADPVRMGVPSARRPLRGQLDLASMTSVVDDVVAQLRGLPETHRDGAVAAALNEVTQSLARLSEAMKSR